MVLTVPVFDSKNIPVIFKAGLTISICIILFPVLDLNTPVITDVITFGIAVTGEVILGVIIGLSVKMIFAGVQLAGNLAGFQMGFMIANVIDPVTKSQVPIIAQFYYFLAILIFLTINAHHWFIRALVESFLLVPPMDFQFTSSLMDHVLRLSGNMFVISIKVGAPVIAVLLLTSISFGLISRTVPQMHIFIVAMPFKIAIGMSIIIISLPYFVSFITKIFNGLGNDILLLLKVM